MINAVSCQFERFVEFAEERVKAGKESAIARTGEVRIEICGDRPRETL